MMNSANNPHVFRQIPLRTIVVVIPLGWLCIWSGLVLLRSERLHLAWIPFALALFLIVHVIHLWVSRVVVNDEGIVFRGLFRETKIPWPEVQFWKAHRGDSDETFAHIERNGGKWPVRIYGFMVAYPGIDAFFESIRQHGRSAALQESK